MGGMIGEMTGETIVRMIVAVTGGTIGEVMDEVATGMMTIATGDKQTTRAA